MRIMVFDVPAESGGALTILNQYYEKAINDKYNEWIFVISTPNLDETENVKILKFPWVKKSWFHRLYFDKFLAHKVVKKYKVDEIISLQNITISNVKVKQTLYLHQPLPFVERRFCIIKNFKFWVYQYIISKMIFSSIKNADKVIVQTRCMKAACIKKVKVDSNKIHVEYPEVNINVKKYYNQELQDNNKLFFYPASGTTYKNHKLIVETLLKFHEKKIDNFVVVFTLKGNENKHIKRLYNIVRKHNLPVTFIGQITMEEVFNYYSKSILIFPSYIETFGLPMFEAKMHGSPVLASDCSFSHEILDDYNKVMYFDPFDYEDLFEKMKAILGAHCNSKDEY